MPSSYRIESLHGRHDRAGFSCGKPALDRYLREQARQDARRKFAAPFVAVAEGAATVAGYYTLSALSVVMSDLPADVVKRLPRYPEVPVTRLGRLAVDTRHRRRGLGEHLLMDSLSRSLAASARVASFAVVVDAIDDGACAFYRHFEFLPFPDQGRRLFLPMRAIAGLFAE